MNNRIPYFIAASTVALLLLIAIQVKWMQQSRNLIEEQFDQKVDMALCQAVDKISKSKETPGLKTSCNIAGAKSSCCKEDLSEFIAEESITGIIDESMDFYNIDMAYETKVSGEEDVSKNKKSYSCSLSPIIEDEGHNLDVTFPDKRSYVLEKMGLMFTSSILILLLMVGIVMYAIYALIKQKKLSERNKEFFNHMAHEFKTPLTNIKLATGLLNKKDVNDPLIDIIKSENKDLSEQVDLVLSMASIESGHFELEHKDIDLKQLLFDIKDQMMMRVEDKAAQLNIVDESNGAIVKGDPFHLSNAIRNLIDNALKYTSDSPQIDIKLSKEHDAVKIQIQDNGIGISEEDKAILFEKFVQIRRADLPAKKGFGLGLSYVKKIMDLHKGSIRVESELSKGTRFDLSLPNFNY